MYSIFHKHNVYIALRVLHCVQKRFRFGKELNDRNDTQTCVDIPINYFIFFPTVNRIWKYWRIIEVSSCMRICLTFLRDGWTDGQTDRQTDRQTDMLGEANVCTSPIFNTNTKEWIPYYSSRPQTFKTRINKTHAGPMSVVSPVRATQHTLDNPIRVTDLLYG